MQTKHRPSTSKVAERVPGRLHRQLVISMTVVTGLTVAVTIAVLPLFYWWAFEFRPDLFDDPEEFWPGPIEWAVYFFLLTLASAAAAFAAIRFARRLIRPLDAVATAARRVAQGNLAARAVVQGGMFEETRQLVDDFNMMVLQLGRAEYEMRTWNAAIAHELRTPLTVLRGRLQGMVDGVFQPDIPSFEGLIQQVDTLTRITDDLNMLSLAQSGRLGLQTKPINLAAEVSSVIAMISAEFQSAGLQIECSLDSAETLGDGARIRQILLALLENARRYASPGRVVVETRAAFGRAILRVTDEGPGLPPGTEAQVFEPFWRADDSRSRAGGGTGLGLAVVQAIAMAHGGIALAKAGLKKGAVFEIHLPERWSC